ncbi:MAG: hypothetical protein JST80_02055 [Bdellovibrionales bacterium]|nr:hypothetical protein [Bdellovibrionales bacterium]
MARVLQTLRRSGSILGPFLISAAVTVSIAGCATSDKAKLNSARNAYLRAEFAVAETAMYSPEVYKNDQNRLLHYYMLSSIAMSEGQYEKALYFLDKARTQAISVRSASGLFEMFSTDYKSNPVEYSALHGMMVMAYSLLASEGRTVAWTTPEIKDDKGNVLVQGMSSPARTYTPKEISEFKQKARAELRAWDTFLETLKRDYAGRNLYSEDLWARILASFVHAISDNNNEKRTGELLAGQAADILGRESRDYPTYRNQNVEITSLINHLRKRAQARTDRSSLMILEAGVMAKYKIRRFHLGLSTIFNNIQDPFLRSQIESIGMQVLLNEAPEFGLVLFTGAIAGAIGGGSGGEDDEFDGPPRFFTDAVDRSFGFEIRFPSLVLPPTDTKVHLLLTKNGVAQPEVAMPIVSPLQEILATDLSKRQDKEMFARALIIGGQYLAVLIPAIKSYQEANREGNAFKKLAILAGYYIAKKVIDNANQPDLRSWNTLPKMIAAQVPEVKPGVYDGKVVIDNHFGRYEASLGPLDFGNPNLPILRKRLGDIDILNRKDVAGNPVP